MAALDRLQKVIARAGVASRREAERLIEGGQVTVNGILVTELGTKVDPDRDDVAVGGERLRSRPRLPLTIVLHKPPGVVSTTRDPEGRKTVLDLVPGLGRRVFPVGRLDWDACGVMVLTDDGDLAHRLMHPRYEVPRTYEAKVKGIPAEADLAAMRAAAGAVGRPARVKALKKGEANAWIELTIHTGRHHEVKEICASAGHPVIRLVRTRYGPIGIGNLAEGRWRRLTAEEIQGLARIGASTAPPPGTGRRTRGPGRGRPARGRERPGGRRLGAREPRPRRGASR